MSLRNSQQSLLHVVFTETSNALNCTQRDRKKQNQIDVLISNNFMLMKRNIFLSCRNDATNGNKAHVSFLLHVLRVLHILCDSAISWRALICIALITISTLHHSVVFIWCTLGFIASHCLYYKPV